MSWKPHTTNIISMSALMLHICDENFWDSGEKVQAKVSEIDTSANSRDSKQSES